LRGYKSHVKRLTEVCPEFPPQLKEVQQLLAGLKGDAYNADAHYRTYRALGNYAERQYEIPNFMARVTRPKITKQIMPTISETELNLLAWKLNEASARDKAIVELFIDTAIRRGEACNLKRKDILEDRIIIHGKTGYRVAPISEITRDLILSLPVQEDGYIFHGRSGKPLGETGFYNVVKMYLNRIGYSGDKQFGPQLLRRSYGRFHLKDGGDMQSLSLILGHKNIVTTATYYAPLLTEDIIAIHQKHTPGRIFTHSLKENGSNDNYQET